ncbi:conserved hypothetical protein [uncultured Alphaproteobacteria bacterium]|uniref:DUF2635 domain-containing protein n=1 Tax=uncultured Alphaproteobacteria bacterium TaxID=91750 RepID=A0A212KK24_9PROT|nr:conserved hypothetical protein [uncultured Alphaproteobacteria bacterium]
MTTVVLKPVGGLRVLDPATMPPEPLPKTGKPVTLDTYWRRRLAAKEVEIVSTAAEKSAQKKGA